MADLNLEDTGSESGGLEEGTGETDVLETADDSAEGDGGEGEEGASEGDVEGQSDDGTPDPFELSAEDYAAIKENPALAKLHKSLIRASTKKFQQAGEAMRLAELYRNDPVGVTKAIAEANGYQLVQPKRQDPVDEQAKAVDAAGAELERLFGAQAGPYVRDIFEKWFNARAASILYPQVAPLHQALGQVMTQAETTRMMSEEQAFKVRHKDVLTQDLHDEIVALGESGRYVPGPNMTPADYLDTLLEIALSRKASREAKNANRNASRRLADRITANRSGREPNGLSNRSGIKNTSGIQKGVPMSIEEAFDRAAREMQDEE